MARQDHERGPAPALAQVPARAVHALGPRLDRLGPREPDLNHFLVIDAGRSPVPHAPYVPQLGQGDVGRWIPTVLPAMIRAEALETTKVYSAMGLAHGLIDTRPFRAPHHTIFPAALIGGGSTPRPGEISLAHNGVLFLDELPEFSRAAIEGLRQPLEERAVTIDRIHGALRLPASFLFVAAANACPCGWLNSRARKCTYSPGAIERYRLRLSGPLFDRIDLQVYVQPVPLRELRASAPGDASAAIRERVVVAANRQRARLRPFHLRCNAEMPSAVQRATCKLDSLGERTLADLVEKRRSFTARSIAGLIKVARTIADLRGQDEFDTGCLLETAAYRDVDPAPASSLTPCDAVLSLGSTR